MDLRGRSDIARYAAPAAFLVAVTILVVLVHSALSSGGGGSTTNAQPTTTARTTTHATTTTSKPKPKTTTGSTASTSTTPAGAQFYTIQSGDTFGSIAAAQGTTIGALEQLNPDVNPNALSVGQQIRIK